jgi:tryptophan 2,3-dioxygenase
VVRNFVEEHLATTSALHESALQHFADIGQTDIEKIGARFAASLEGAREFLLPDGQVDRARAGLLFIESYRDLPLLAWPRALVDSVVEMEQSMLLFRTHHARMVERMIGRRVGTGGSSGVDYLDATTKMRIFTDLWAVRTLLIKRSELPPVKKPEAYGFRG